MNKITQLGNLRKGTPTFSNPQCGKVYSIDGIAPTISTCQGGMREPKVLDKKGSERIGLKTMDEYRIRKLTPKECFRLMGFPDEAFDKAKEVGVSNTQLYKQAGNSIVTDVLYYIFKELYKAMPYLFDDLKLGSYFSGIGAFEIGLNRLFDDIK